MKNRLILFIYDYSGSYVKLKRFTSGHLWLLAGIVLALAAACSVALVHYAHLIAAHEETRELKHQVTELKSSLAQRDEQIKEFTVKIDGLQLKLVKLNRYEQKIRQLVGKKAGGDNLEAYGIGGTISESAAADFLSSEEYHQIIRGIDDSVESVGDAAEAQQNQFEALWKTLRALKNLEAATPSIRPVDGGWISSTFGYRLSPFTGKRELHSGVDIACQKGTPIKATADGKVVYAGVKGLMGKTVVVDHGFGIKTRYGHLNKIRVTDGQKVTRNEVIGEMGSTGRSTGPHVHYEVRLNDVPVDAEKYMTRRLAEN
ncbi:MAG: peptidoglycan DD-metalloendopeptidase family protein [Desulfobacterales bacterium]|nr:peptidoglycan DD-metalloendopeptidase family protein [Desulfobacterales bacterium]